MYEGNEDLMILQEWIRQVEKIFDVVEVPDNKHINIGAFYLSGTTDMWWGTVRTTFQGSEATWASFTKLRIPNSTLCICKNKNKRSS